MKRRACRCGHPYDAHQHYTRSARCSLCDWCIVYQPRRWWRRTEHPAAGTDAPDTPPPGQNPAGGEPPAFPPAGDGSHLPGLIPPPPTTHPGTVVRLAVVYECGEGRYCGWVWRPGQGWKHQHECVPPLPTADQWDWWGAHLWETR